MMRVMVDTEVCDVCDVTEEDLNSVEDETRGPMLGDDEDTLLAVTWTDRDRIELICDEALGCMS